MTCRDDIYCKSPCPACKCTRTTYNQPSHGNQNKIYCTESTKTDNQTYAGKSTPNCATYYYRNSNNACLDRNSLPCFSFLQSLHPFFNLEFKNIQKSVSEGPKPRQQDP